MNSSTMEFVLVSDLHVDLNHWDWEVLDPFSSTKTLVVAGDISNDVWEACRWLREARTRFENLIWVAGNHDFYNLGFHQTRMVNAQFEQEWPYPSCVPEMVQHYRRWCKAHDIHFLHRNSVLIGNVRFIGATGWHDYQAGEPYSSSQQIDAWYRLLHDTHIKWEKSVTEPDHRYALEEGAKDHAYIQDALAAVTEPVVVITHHLPHRRLSWQRPHDPSWTMIHGSFVNTRMESVSSPHIRYWIHGHTHRRHMVDIDGMTYVCNARGYVGENHRWEPILLEV